jgi:hypothetical protein
MHEAPNFRAPPLRGSAAHIPKRRGRLALRPVNGWPKRGGISLRCRCQQCVQAAFASAAHLQRHTLRRRRIQIRLTRTDSVAPLL